MYCEIWHPPLMYPVEVWYKSMSAMLSSARADSLRNGRRVEVTGFGITAVYDRGERKQ